MLKKRLHEATTRLLIIVLLAFWALPAMASLYQPHPDKVKSSINVRSSQSTQAPVIHQYKVGEQFEVIEINGNWATVEVNGQTGYVNASYIKSVPSAQTTSVQSRDKGHWYDFLDISIDLTHKDVSWMVWLILGLLVAMYIVSTLELDDDYAPWILQGLMLSVGVCEIIYFLGMKSNFLWFCTEPRWWWCAINGLLFVAAALYQVSMLIGMVEGVTDDNASIGIYSVPVGIVVGIILAFVNANLVGWVFGLVLLAQVVQAIIVFVKAMDMGIPMAILATLTYIVAVTATLIVLVYALIIVVIALVALFVLMALGSGGDRDLHLKSLGNGLYQDDNGNLWRRR